MFRRLEELFSDWHHRHWADNTHHVDHIIWWLA